MTRHITCIECPMGCQIEAEEENGVVTNVRGNSCPRGKAYAESELVCPVRVVTSVVRAQGGKMVPVKTSKPVRKSEIFRIMEVVNGLHPAPNLGIGDVLVRGIDGDADLIVTGNPI